ncbi:hypothetical protein HMPREF1544_04473, partial [Mucor circinelloides 1006PhL]
RIIESIAISSNGYFIYITQAEAYLRNAIETYDCANSTIIVGFPGKLIFIVEPKGESINQWFEKKHTSNSSNSSSQAVFVRI